MAVTPPDGDGVCPQTAVPGHVFSDVAVARRRVVAIQDVAQAGLVVWTAWTGAWAQRLASLCTFGPGPRVGTRLRA
jgi:hypothetical protein